MSTRWAFTQDTCPITIHSEAGIENLVRTWWEFQPGRAVCEALQSCFGLDKLNLIKTSFQSDRVSMANSSRVHAEFSCLCCVPEFKYLSMIGRISSIYIAWVEYLIEREFPMPSAKHDIEKSRSFEAGWNFRSLALLWSNRLADWISSSCRGRVRHRVTQEHFSIMERVDNRFLVFFLSTLTKRFTR